MPVLSAEGAKVGLEATEDVRSDAHRLRDEGQLCRQPRGETQCEGLGNGVRAYGTWHQHASAYVPWANFQRHHALVGLH